MSEEDRGIIPKFRQLGMTESMQIVRRAKMTTCERHSVNIRWSRGSHSGGHWFDIDETTDWIQRVIKRINERGLK